MNPNIDSAKIKELDVRPILRSGGEPFSVIMKAISETPADGALRLRATFKPVPLFRVLAGQGWQHRIEEGEGDDWVILFYRGSGDTLSDIRDKEATLSRLHKKHPELRTRLRAEGNTWTLDVRALPPPEPMELTLAVLDRLPPGAELVQINERVPRFLLPILSDRGLGCRITEASDTEVRLRIGGEA